MIRMLNALALLLSTTMVVAQDERPEDLYNHFVYPPLPADQFTNNPDPIVFWTDIVLTVGEEQAEPFKWVTNMTSMQIVLQQEGNPESVQSRPLTGNSRPHSLYKVNSIYRLHSRRCASGEFLVLERRDSPHRSP